jgi:hypothetical protein
MPGSVTVVEQVTAVTVSGGAGGAVAVPDDRSSVSVGERTNGVVTVDTGHVGETGEDGAPGPQNLFVQEAQPVMTTPGIWVELNPDGTPKTVWVGTTV